MGRKSLVVRLAGDTEAQYKARVRRVRAEEREREEREAQQALRDAARAGASAVVKPGAIREKGIRSANVVVEDPDAALLSDEELVAAIQAAGLAKRLRGRR